MRFSQSFSVQRALLPLFSLSRCLTWRIILFNSTAVLSVLYTVYRTLAEWAVRGDDASSPPSGTYPTALASTTLPAIYQKPSYNGSFQWQQPVGYNPVQMA